VAALDALIEATKREPQSVVVELCTRIEADTAQTGWEAVASRRKRRTKTR
jgi:phage baseplate assembly protein gpV